MKVSEMSGIVVQATVNGIAPVYFFVNDPADGIQSVHYSGQFWDPKDLEIMSRYIHKDTRYLDIGCNVGNHVIYLGKKFGLRNMAVVDPSPTAIQIFRINMALNGLTDSVDTRALGYGLSDADGKAVLQIPAGNLGGAQCRANPGGNIALTTGDALFPTAHFDFIKMDVEWLEIQCLAGLKNLIARCRPVMFIEVSGTNRPLFKQWCLTNKYSIVESLEFTSQQANYLVVPQ